MDTNTNATHSDMPGPTLTMDSIREVVERCRFFPLDDWRVLVVTPELRQVLVSRASGLATLTHNSLYGLDVWEKPGQIMPCWKFKNRQLALDYLNGKVSEFDLINRVDQKDLAFQR